MGNAMLAQDFVHSLAKRTRAAITRCSRTNAGSFASARSVQVENITDRHRPWLETTGAFVFPKNFGSLSEPAPLGRASSRRTSGRRQACSPTQRTALHRPPSRAANLSTDLQMPHSDQTDFILWMRCSAEKKDPRPLPKFLRQGFEKNFYFFSTPSLLLPLGRRSRIEISDTDRARQLDSRHPARSWRCRLATVGENAPLESTRSASEGRNCLGQLQAQSFGQKKTAPGYLPAAV